MKLGSQYKARKRLFLRLATGGLLLLCVPISVSVFQRYQIERDMAARVIELQEEYQALEARKATLEKRVEYLKDERSVEAEVRRSFDVAREGEQVVIILDNDSEGDRSVRSLSEPEPPAPWYQFWR